MLRNEMDGNERFSLIYRLQNKEMNSLYRASTIMFYGLYTGRGEYNATMAVLEKIWATKMK